MNERKTAGIGKGTPGPGRGKGNANKLTKDLRAMILGALDSAGGERYLADQAIESPGAFLALVGKCLPKDLNITAKVSLADLIRDARARLKNDARG